MKESSCFENLFVFDMANNHQGDIAHGQRIIKEIGRICKEKNVKGGMKLQYRQIETFIHPEHKQHSSSKHIKRFMETRLENEKYRTLVDEAKRVGLKTICTPFDEESVDVIEQHGIEIIKIASCSAQDWPLLERIALSRRPVICSTAGLSISEIDKVVSFFSHRKVPLALMHCVAIYPTTALDLQMNQIDLLKNRYPFLPIGFSTHEAPDNLHAVIIAVAKGAMLLERHVGIETDTIKLNAYSSTPQQIEKWIEKAMEAKVACGAVERLLPKDEEKKSLISLMRGVYAKRDITAKEEIRKEDVYFAMPLLEGQLSSGQFYDGIISNKAYPANSALDSGLVDTKDIKRQVYSVIHQIKGMLYNARIAIGKEFRVELSHHYGIDQFEKVGAVIIDCVNREYCKKLVIQIPNQTHPTHYHEKKEETFQVLWGKRRAHSKTHALR
jgi:N-acetylneuraminate synthase